MSTCDKCKKPLNDEDKLACSVCKISIHYLCGGLSESNFKILCNKKTPWKCFDCNKKRQESALVSGPTDGGELKTLFNSLSSNLMSKFNELSNKITNKIEGFEESMNFNSTQMENILKEFKELKEKYKEMLVNEEVLKKENNELRKTIEEIKQSSDDKNDAMENRSRIENLEIKNIPESKGENVVEIVKLIGQAIGVENIMEGDIQVAHRVDSMNKERGQRTIIVHMGSRYIRNIWLQKFRNMKHTNSLTAKNINSKFPNTVVYVNEHITVKRKQLLKETKDFAKENNIKYVWIKDGFILLKKNDSDTRVHKISTKAELEEYKKKNGNFTS